jgi:hypothetical protein
MTGVTVGCGGRLTTNWSWTRDRQPEHENHRERRGPCGHEAGKKIKGRKRHIVTDTPGLMVGLVDGADFPRVVVRNGTA